jgi:hypothetical protein
MQIDREVVPELAPLAWLFDGTRRSSFRLLHGSAVCVQGDDFLEGCLAGDWNQDARGAAHVFGSGLSTRNGTCCFLTPSHTLESLYLYRSRGGWSVSNSLALLAAYHELTPPWDPHYGARFASLCLGIDAYEKTLFRSRGGEVTRVAYDNLELTQDGGVRRVRKPLPPPFPTFEQYVEYLSRTLELASAHAANPHRSHVYLPLTTCSTGYDSPCATALAATLGCREAVTLRNARSGGTDSGAAIAERLGLRVQVFDRPATVDGPFEEVADFLATGMGGEDYCYRGFAPSLRGRLLMSGFHGGTIWGTHGTPDAVISRGDVSGSSLQEFRLWNDFIHVPVPTIGARRRHDIAAISRSPEMSNYHVRGKYDRPIPRRIVEQAGVPRSFFGQDKKATSLLLFRDWELIAPDTWRQCEAEVPGRWVRSARFGPARMSWVSRYHAYRLLRRYGKRIPGRAWLTQSLIGEWRVFEHSHPLAALQFVAGLSIVSRRYKEALHGRCSGRW